MRLTASLAALLLLCACAANRAQGGAEPVSVEIIAFNDFHGALAPPGQAIAATARNGDPVRVPAGGAAYLASAVARLRSAHPNAIVVAAGDLISASPLASAEFLDEPTILAMNRIGVDLSAVGNHEFDRGRQELLRMQKGGCERFTVRVPCRLDRFPGARFTYLAANVVTEDGSTIFPGYAIRSFGSGARQVRIGFIGLTLKQTATLVSPGGVAGLRFEDEAASINALVPKLRSEGADAIVVLIHQGLSTKVGYDDHSCAGVDGNLLPVLARLDPSIALVVSGHTHNSYICDYGRIDRGRPFLVTSAGKYGTLLTDITLSIDPARKAVVSRRADNVIVQGEAFTDAKGAVPVSADFPRYPADPEVAALVGRYAAAVAPLSARIVGRLPGPALKDDSAGKESVLGDLIADAFLAATQAPEAGGARIAFQNSTGVRADIVPVDGSVSYGQIFAAQPFANNIVVESLTGRQIRALLEQQFDSGSNTQAHPALLQPSRGVSYGYDLTRPAGERIIDLRLDGAPVRDGSVYRVATNSFLAGGGDNFTVFTQGKDVIGGPLDIDALERYIASGAVRALPVPNRTRRISGR
jgi:5'-nucleotidase